MEVGYRLLVEDHSLTVLPQAIFPPFHVDLQSAQLYEGPHAIRLRPKTFAVLQHLLSHADRLVTRAELVAAVWHDARGSEALPKGCIRELREALGDDTAAPRFIASVGRRGYRFIAPVTYADGTAARAGAGAPGLRRAPRVGRDAELGHLLRLLDRAGAAERQVVFVTGEPGIGKTTVVEAFCRQVGDACVARGQCIEQYGAGEPYMPVLEALGRLCREPGGDAVVAVLDRHAPTWLAQLPALVGAADLDALQRRIQGASRERMLREMTDAVEVLAGQRPFVLVLEDLHWSDQSTVDLIAALARRRHPARLLVLGTYRPADLIVYAHPLRAVQRDLAAHGEGEEIPLRLLTAPEVFQYLAVRFPAHEFAPALGHAVHRATEGNPLFMVNVVEDLVARGEIVEQSGRWRCARGGGDLPLGVPDSLRLLIESYVDRLDGDERRLLEAASVAGNVFSVPVVAAGLDLDPERVDERLYELSRRGAFVRPAEGGSPSELLGTRYEFLHALYPKVLYDRLAAAPRRRLHQRIAEAEEARRGGGAGEIAAYLAVHFERAHDPPRAIRYLRLAAENALQRYALREAGAHLERALELIPLLPTAVERAAQELPLQVMMGGVLMATVGYGSLEVERAYDRARKLSDRLRNAPALFPVVRGLHRFYLVRAQIDASHRLATRCRSIATASGDPALLVEAHLALGETACYLGKLRTAAGHLERARALDGRVRRRAAPVRTTPWDPRVSGRYHRAFVLWLRGRPDAAARTMAEARAIAEASSRPFDLTYVLSGSAFLHHLRGEPEETTRWVDASILGADAHGFPIFAALGTMFRGWVLATCGREADGIEAMRRGYAELNATESVLMNPYWLALPAEACARAGRARDGLALVRQARAALAETEERWCLPELRRVEGEVVLAAGGAGAARRAARCFRNALDLAHRQGAMSFELRAATSLARLWTGTRRAAEARRLLGRVHRRFAEGFETGDLVTAQRVLDALG